MEVERQESTIRNTGKGLMKGLMYGALAGVGLMLLPNVPLIGNIATPIINVIGSLAEAATGLLTTAIHAIASEKTATTIIDAITKAFPKIVVEAGNALGAVPGAAAVTGHAVVGAVTAGVATLVGATSLVGGLLGAMGGATKEKTVNHSVQVDLVKSQIKEAALGELVQEQQRAIEAVVAQSAVLQSQQTLAGQPLVRGAHCQAEENKRAAMAFSGPQVG